MFVDLGVELESPRNNFEGLGFFCIFQTAFGGMSFSDDAELMFD
jgi:hypothetical protein